MGMMAMGVMSLIGTVASIAMAGGGASAPAAPPPPPPAPPPPTTDDLDIQLEKNEEERRRSLMENTNSKDTTKNRLNKEDTLGRTTNLVEPKNGKER